jgi:hypothetical protein
MGQIADQSFTSTDYVVSSSNAFYMGPGDYTSVWTGDATNSVTLTSDVSGMYPIAAAWFGNTLTNGTNQYFGLNENSATPATVNIATNYQGLGLGYYEWNQVVGMLRHISADVKNDLSCDDQQGGICQLSKSCSDSAYTDLWNYNFKF